MNRNLRHVIVPLAVAVVGTSGFAFMADNIVQSSKAGEGRGDVSGYQVTDIAYNVENRPAPDFGRVTSVSFTLDAPANVNNVAAYLQRGASDAIRYDDCAADANVPNRFTCTGFQGQQAGLQNVSGLIVSAAQ